MRAYLVKWLWERSASMLAVMLMAVVVLVRESMSYAKRPSP